VDYDALDMQPDICSFRESGPVPRDARLIEHTWQYVNKNGGPDRRFAHNPRIPVVAYPTSTWQSPSGIHIRLMFSSMDVMEQFMAAAGRPGSDTAD
jgi:hypothetical protein